jgi:CheY-like chemotaxis protein
MVVDDALSELKLIEGILKSAGHQVVSYHHGELLEDRVVEERPDLLLLDIVMPATATRCCAPPARSRTKDTRWCS